MRDERSEVGGQIDDRNMRDRKMMGGAFGWCIKHPNNGFLLPPYSRSTRVLLSSYWPPKPAVLLESCFAETAKNREMLDVRHAKKKTRSQTQR